jgi:hypothetical protein
MDRAEVFIEQSKEVALVMARMDAYAQGRGFVLRRNRSGVSDATLEEAAARFARDKTEFKWSVDVQAFQAARAHNVKQWWTWSLIDVEPAAGADHVCFESAEVVRELIDTQLLEAADDRGEFNPPLEAAAN